ncbi:MAG: insulinase family protein [Saprospiraceae bacterium]|nr:insulinase family protein [Saprospiraceae bacterium]
MTPEHIEAATMDDVKAFYSRYYNASNAIMTICGDVDPDQVIGLVKKHFAHLSPGPQNHAVYPQEDPRTEIQMVNYYEDIPEEAIFIALPAPARLEGDFYALDFLTDLLSEGKSSILFRELKKELQIFTSIDCYLTASADPGLIIIEGKLVEGVDIETGEREIMRVIDRYKSELISDRQWAKYRTKNETA